MRLKAAPFVFFVSLLRSQGARADPSPRFAPPAAAANGFPTDVSLIHRGVQSASDLVPDPLLHFGEKKMKSFCQGEHEEHAVLSRDRRRWLFVPTQKDLCSHAAPTRRGGKWDGVLLVEGRRSPTQSRPLQRLIKVVSEPPPRFSPYNLNQDVFVALKKYKKDKP